MAAKKRANKALDPYSLALSAVSTTATFDTLRTTSKLLASKGFHDTSPWWKDALAKFYSSGVKRFVGRIGRGGIKSTTMVDVAVNEVLFGNFNVPLGECHYFAFVSQSKAEASQRLRQIAARLEALGIEHEPKGDEIVIPALRRGFRIFACQVGAVSGFRCIGFVADELAKWTNADHSANPAPEVIASIRAMTVTHPGAREFFVSSPLATLDLHYELVEAGNSDAQIVAIAPTWTANPGVTEESTKLLERDKRIWMREYGAVPQASISGAFEPEAIDRAFVERPLAMARGDRIVVLDPSSGKKDSWTWGIAGWAFNEDGTSYLKFDVINGVEGRFFESITSSDLVTLVSSLAANENIDAIHSDQRESFALQSAFADKGFAFVTHDWTVKSKPEAVEKLRRWMAEGRLQLPEHPKLRTELLAFEERITPSGAFTFGARGSGHDDYVALLLTATMALAEADGHANLPPKLNSLEWNKAQARAKMDNSERAEMESAQKEERGRRRVRSLLGLN